MCVGQDVLKATALLANTVRIAGTIPAVPVVRTLVRPACRLHPVE
jgi:hypothetical protein